MSEIVLSAEHLSKQYVLGTGRDRFRTLRDAMAQAASRSVSRLKDGERKSSKREILYALQDVSFEVKQGDVLGVIGRNGAGKSTLLKILSRITEPTSGRARIRGRVGSLLEVGTGFHGELTGRENVYLNGAILGMKRADIDLRFDEIVDFAEVSRFLDTPVKRYSSGMTVRLAFAVAAHLEPEILLVDEVLAVGDVAFQRKCIGKMTEVAGEGRTVLFVSHNMAIMQALCKRGLLLEGGKVHTDGTIDEAVSGYLRSVEESGSASDLLERTDTRGWREVRLSEVEITGGDGDELLATGRPARFVFNTVAPYDTDSPVGRRLTVTFTIFNSLGQPICTLDSGDNGPADVEHPGQRSFVCDIPQLPLVPGRYRIDVEVHGRAYLQDGVEGAATFDVEQGTLNGRPVSGGHKGDIALGHVWTVPSLD